MSQRGKSRKQHALAQGNTRSLRSLTSAVSPTSSFTNSDLNEQNLMECVDDLVTAFLAQEAVLIDERKAFLREEMQREDYIVVMHDPPKDWQIPLILLRRNKEHMHLEKAASVTAFQAGCTIS